MVLKLRQSCLLHSCVIVYFNFVLFKLFFDLLSFSQPLPSRLHAAPNTNWDHSAAQASNCAVVAATPKTLSCSPQAVVLEDRRNWSNLFYASHEMGSGESEAIASLPPLSPLLVVDSPPLVIEDRRNWSSLFVAGQSGAVGPGSSRTEDDFVNREGPQRPLPLPHSGGEGSKSQSLVGEAVSDASTPQLHSFSSEAAGGESGRETQSLGGEASVLADASSLQIDSLSSLADTAAAATATAVATAADPALAPNTTLQSAVASEIASEGRNKVVQPELTADVRSLTESILESLATATTSAGSSADDIKSGSGNRSVSPSSAMTVSFVACRLGIGRLGNSMFIYASALGVALRHGVALALVVDSSTQPYVQQLTAVFRLGSATVLPLGSGTSFTDVVNEAGWGRYTPKVEDMQLFQSAQQLASPSNGSRSAAVLLSGYLQSWKYFEAYADRVRADFAFAEPLARAADEYMRSLPGAGGAASSRTLLVGIHVRRGDMVGSSFYGVAPPGYLHTAMDYVVSRHGPAVFIATSDDVGWTRQALTGSTHAVVYPERSAELDLAILARCNHTIITGGSYGWWAGWLAGGDVVYYLHFMPKSSPLFEGHLHGDYYPPRWLGLE